MESLVSGVAYLCADDEFAITTSNGHIRMTKEDAKSIAQEIVGICNDIDHIKNWKRGEQ